MAFAAAFLSLCVYPFLKPDFESRECLFFGLPECFADIWMQLSRLSWPELC